MPLRCLRSKADKPLCFGRLFTMNNRYSYKQGDLVGGFIFIKETSPSYVKNKNGKLYPLRRAMFMCSCGKCVETSISNAKSNHTNSCGCSKGKKMTKQLHNSAYNDEYRIWRGILNRATNPNCKYYKSYGGRGISVDNSWLDFNVFINDIGARPFSGASIDRIDNNKGYSKENCRWATPKQQCRNRRNNVFIEYKNEKLTIAEWSEKTGISIRKIQSRYKRNVQLDDIFYNGILKPNTKYK